MSTYCEEHSFSLKTCTQRYPTSEVMELIFYNASLFLVHPVQILLIKPNKAAWAIKHIWNNSQEKVTLSRKIEVSWHRCIPHIQTF
jgi:hypothetical protein